MSTGACAVTTDGSMVAARAWQWAKAVAACGPPSPWPMRLSTLWFGSTISVSPSLGPCWPAALPRPSPSARGGKARIGKHRERQIQSRGRVPCIRAARDGKNLDVDCPEFTVEPTIGGEVRLHRGGLQRPANEQHGDPAGVGRLTEKHLVPIMIDPAQIPHAVADLETRMLG